MMEKIQICRGNDGILEECPSGNSVFMGVGMVGGFFPRGEGLFARGLSLFALAPGRIGKSGWIWEVDG